MAKDNKSPLSILTGIMFENILFDGKEYWNNKYKHYVP